MQKLELLIGQQIKCVQSKKHEGCENCIFKGTKNCYAMNCISVARQDKKNVHFEIIIE